jgi:hypothetical protein
VFRTVFQGAQRRRWRPAAPRALRDATRGHQLGVSREQRRSFGHERAGGRLEPREGWQRGAREAMGRRQPVDRHGEPLPRDRAVRLDAAVEGDPRPTAAALLGA